MTDVATGEDNSPADKEKETDSGSNQATGDTSIDATTSTTAEQEAIVAIDAEGVPPQAVEPTTDAAKTSEPDSSKLQEDLEPVSSASSGRPRNRDAQARTQPSAEAQVSETADGEKQAGVGDVAIKETKSAKKTTAPTAKQSDHADPTTGQSTTDSLPVEAKDDDTSRVTNLREKTTDDTTKYSENPTRIAPRKQTTTSGDDEAAVIVPRITSEVEKTDDAESGGARRSSKSKKTTSKHNKGTQAINADAIAPDRTTQPASEAAAKSTATQITDATAKDTEANDRSKPRVEVGGEDSKPITRVGQRTLDTASETIGRTTSETSEAKETTRAETTHQHPEVDRTRFVQRVARAFGTVGSRGGTLRLRLSPPELGSLRIEINVQGSTLTARIEAETSAARTVLLDSLPALRERLSGQNINIDRFDVDLLNQSADDSSRQPTGDRDRGRGAGQFGGGNTSHRPVRENKGVAGTSAAVFGDDTQLNVVV